MTLDTLIKEIPRIGPVFQRKLQRMGIETVEDLIFHFPHRYEDFSNIVPISKINPAEQNCILGKVLEIKTIRTWKKKMFLTQSVVEEIKISSPPLANARVVEDKTETIKVIWFNQPYLTNVIKKNDFLCLAGRATPNKGGIYLSNPIFEKISDPQSQDPKTGLIHTGRIIPVYPETEGLSSRWFRYILKPLLSNFKDKILETLPEEIIREEKLLPIRKAIWQIHFPDSLHSAEKAKERFSFEELLLLELFVIREKLKLNKEMAPSISTDIDLIKKFVQKLPFRLTDAQRKSTWQILKDIERPRPMSRLLQGDVGSGKTVVAIIASLNTVKSGYQTAFMAPTEILAKQHFQETTRLLKPFKIRIALLTGKEDKIVSQKLARSVKSGLIPEILEISQSKLLEKIRKGEIDILIGTHSLIQNKVKFGKLGLSIIDEQHRFGINQRAKLCQEKDDGVRPRQIPHLLSMTATPIPRSLALTIYGDLDLSIIDEMPKGRKKVITKIVPSEERNKTYNFIRGKVKKGEQVFVICPRIDNPATDIAPEVTETNSKISSLWDNVKAVKEEYEKLSKEIFSDLRIEMLHGKMKIKEKEKIMASFKNKKIDILVSTSVVEVGIDVPNATIMIIEGAEKFGLAQLYQFRGRVGRSNLQSYCFLFAGAGSQKTYQRLNSLIKAKNGLELAQKDLKIRGPGSLIGAKQWGIPDLTMGNLNNINLIEKTRNTAKEILRQGIELRKYPSLKKRLEKFKMKIHLE